MRKTTQMTWLEKWFLMRLCRRLVIQGPNHRGNVIEYLRVIREAARKEFTEENEVGIDSFMRECCEAAAVVKGIPMTQEQYMYVNGEE